MAGDCRIDLFTFGIIPVPRAGLCDADWGGKLLMNQGSEQAFVARMPSRRCKHEVGQLCGSAPSVDTPVVRGCGGNGSNGSRLSRCRNVASGACRGRVAVKNPPTGCVQ